MNTKTRNRREFLSESALMTAVLLALIPFDLASADTKTPQKSEPDILKQINRAVGRHKTNNRDLNF